METLMPPAELETGSALVTVSGVASQSCRDESTFARSSLDNLSAADTLAHPSSSLPFLNAGTLSPYSMPGVIYSSGKISPTPSCRSMGRSPSPMQPDTSTKLKTLTPFVLRNRRDEPRSSSAERLSASVDELAAVAASLVSGVSRRSPLGRIREGVPAADASTEEEKKTITTDNSVELNRKLEGLQEAAKIGAPATTQATKTTPSLLQAAAATGGGEQGHEPVPAPPEEERRSSRDRTQVVVDESRTRQRPTIFSDIRERVFGPQQTTQEPLGGRRQPPPPWPDKKPVSVSRQNEEVAKTTEKPAELDPKSVEEFSSTWQDSGADDGVVWKRREEADDGVVWKKQQAEDLGKSYAAKVTEPVKVTDNQDAQKQPGANQALEPVDKTQEEAKHPVESSSKPVESSPKPVESSSKPVESSPKPVESSPKPVESSSKAVEGTAEKVASEPPVESPSARVATETSSVVPQPPVIVVEPVDDAKDQTDLNVKATAVQTPIPVGQQVPAEQGTEKAGEKAVSVVEFGGKLLEDKEPENTDNQTKMLSTEQRDKMNLERRRQLMDRMAAKRAQTLKGLQKKMEDAIDIASHFKPVDMGTVFTRPDKQTTASAENDARQPTANASRPATLPQGTLILYQQGEPIELLKRADSAEALARQGHTQRLSKEGAFLADSIAAQNAAVALAKSQPTLAQMGGLEARGFTKALTVKEPQPGVRGAGGISPSQLFTSTSTSARKPDKDPGVVPPKTQQPVKTGATPPTIGQPVAKSGATLSAATRPVAMTAAVAPAVTQPIVRTGPPPPAVTQPVIKTGAVPPAITKPVTQPAVKTGTVAPAITQPVVKTGTVAPAITQPVVKTGTVAPAITQPVVKTHGTVALAITQPVVKTGTVAPPVTQPVVKTGTVAPAITQPVVKTGAIPQPVTQSVVKTGTVAPPVTQPVVKPGAIPPTVTQPVVKTGTVPPAVTQPDVRAPAVSPAATQAISGTGVVLPAGVQPGVKSESVPLVVTRSEPKPPSALLISPKSRVDWAKQKFASSDVLDPNFGLSVEPVSSKTPAQQQETDLPATTTIPVTKEASLQVRQGSELSEDFRGAPENKSAPAVELSSATSYIELTQIAEITPCVAPPIARQIVQQPSVKPPVVTAPDFPAMGQQAPSLQTTAKPPDTSQSPALQITQQSVVAKPPAAALPGPALQITQQSVVKPPVVNQAQPVTTAVTPPRVQVISQQVATKPQPPVSPHLQITQTSTIRAAETQQQTTQTPLGSSFTRPEQPPPPPQQQQPASIAPTARQPPPSATIIRSAPDHPGAQTTQRPPTGIQISTSSKQILPPSVVMETRQTEAETRPVRDQPPVDPRVRGQGSRSTPAQEEPRTVPILMRVPSATDRTESVVCNPIVYAYVSDPDVQEIRMSVREEVKPAIVLEPDVPESRLVTVLPAGSGSGLRGSSPLQETRTTQISNELYKQTSPLGRPGEASSVSNAGQTRTRVFDPPLVPEVPLSPAAIWSNTSITLNQQFPPAEDATTRDRPVPRTTTTTTTAATSHVGGYSSQGQGQIEAAQPQTKVRFQPAPTAETQRVRSAEAVQPPDRTAGHHRHHIAEGSRDAKDEDSLMIIRAPAHGSGSDPGQTRLVSSLQLQPKTEPAPISPPVVQAASHRNPAPDQRDRKLPEESSRFSIPISVESSAKKTAAAAPVQVRHHVTQDQAKQTLTPAADPHHRQVTIGAAVDAGKQQQQQQQQLTVKDEPKSGPPSPRPGGGTEGDKGHQLGTNLSRVMEVLAKKETEAKKPVKKGLDSMGKSLDGSGAIRKQLIQMESALHPSSAYRSETVPPRRSPRLLRKPKPLLSKSQTIDVSGLKAERELAVFLKTRKEVSSSDDEDVSRSRSPRRTSTETRDLDFGNCDLKTVSVLDRIKVMETKVGKTFFSALRAQATAFRAAQAASEDQQQQQQRSEEEKRVDRLANFALISDVSVGQRRRQFMTKRHQTTKARSNSLPRTYDEFIQAENHPGVERLRTDVLSRHPWSYPLRCLHRQPRPAPRRRSVRRRSLPVHLDRLPPETAGPPRPPSGHGPHRPPPSRLLAAPAISVISEEAVESPPVQAQAYPLPPLPPGFREATRGPAAASSSSSGRLRIEMPPSPAIDVTGIVPGSELSTPSTPLSANIGWARGEGGGAGGGGGRLGLLRRRSAEVMDSDDEFDKMVEINIKELGVGAGVVGAGVGRVGGTPDSKAQPPRQPLQRQPPPTQQQPLSVQHAHPMQQQQQAATQQRQQQPPQQQQQQQQQQQPQQQQSGQLRQIEHQAPSSSSSLTASQQPHRPQQQQQSAPDLAEVQSPTDSFTLQPIASRVKEWDAAIAEEKAAARAQQLLLLQDPKADVDHLGIKRAAPEARSPRLSTENRKSIGSEFLTEGGVQEGPEGQSEDELSKLSLAEKLKFFSALTTTQPPEPPPPTSKRGKGKRTQTRHQTQYEDQQPVTSEEVEQAVSSRQRQHPYQQQQQQQYEQQQYQPQQQYQQQLMQQQYYQQQQYQQPQYQQQQQYLQQYQQPPYQDQQYFQQYQQPLYQHQQYQQHMYQQQQTYNPVASRHIYRDY